MTAGPANRLPASQTVAVVERAGDEGARLREPHLAVAAKRLRRIFAGEGMLGEGRLAYEADRLDPEGDELHGLLLRHEAVHALVRGGEAFAKPVEGIAAERGFGHRHGELVVLPRVAHVDGAVEAPVRGGNALALEPVLGPALQGREGAFDRGRAPGFEGHQPGRGKIGAQVGQEEAHGAQNARIARHEHAPDLELAREPRRVKRAGAAERHHGVVARIVAALDRNDPDRTGHVGGDDGQDTLRRFHKAEAELAGETPDRLLGKILPHRHAPAQQMRRD